MMRILGIKTIGEELYKHLIELYASCLLNNQKIEFLVKMLL